MGGAYGVGGPSVGVAHRVSEGVQQVLSENDVQIKLRPLNVTLPHNLIKIPYTDSYLC